MLLAWVQPTVSGTHPLPSPPYKPLPPLCFGGKSSLIRCYTIIPQDNINMVSCNNYPCKIHAIRSKNGISRIKKVPIRIEWILSGISPIHSKCKRTAHRSPAGGAFCKSGRSSFCFPARQKRRFVKPPKFCINRKSFHSAKHRRRKTGERYSLDHIHI